MKWTEELRDLDDYQVTNLLLFVVMYFYLFRDDDRFTFAIRNNSANFAN
jgi:hypothetical protein